MTSQFTAREREVYRRKKKEVPGGLFVLLLLGLLLLATIPWTSSAADPVNDMQDLYNLTDSQQEAAYCRLLLSDSVSSSGVPSQEALVAHCDKYL